MRRVSVNVSAMLGISSSFCGCVDLKMGFFCFSVEFKRCGISFLHYHWTCGGRVLRRSNEAQAADK